MTTRLLICLVAALVLHPVTTSGQVAGAESPAKSNSGAVTGQGAEAGTPGSVGFSIETEMFTYKAVEENSEVVACDVARYLYGGEIGEAAVNSHAPCAINNPRQSTPGIVILSSTSTLLSDFQVWRADMATMSDLEARASKVCIPPPSSSVGIAKPGAPSGSHDYSPQATGKGFLGSTPAGQAGSSQSARGDNCWFG